MPIHSPYLLCPFSLTASSSFFPRQFCGFISQSFQQSTSQTYLLLHLNGFKTKSKWKWIFKSKENTKLLTVSHDMIKTTWMSESSIILLLETEFLTSKSCNTLWKKSMLEHMWPIFCGSPMFDFFLTFWLWKPLTHMLFMWGFIFQASKYYSTHTYKHTCPYIHMYTQANISNHFVLYNLLIRWVK